MPSRSPMAFLRAHVSELLMERSILRHHKHPSRKNSLQSLAFIVIAFPFAILVFPFLLLFRMFGKKLFVTVLATDGEFGPFMNLMEFMRGQPTRTNEILFVLSRQRHKTFCAIYRNELKRPIWWSNGTFGLAQQVVLLQPKFLVETRQITPVVANEMPQHAVKLSAELETVRTATLKNVDLLGSRYIAMAVHTTQYDEEANIRYASAEASRESDGSELAMAIDFLESQNLRTVLLGAKDTRKSHIPRNIPRLSEFGQHGGPQEVVIASGCEYFWTDDVGAWWLAVPFGRPVLFTNFTRILIRRGVQPRGHLVVPARYETLDGRKLTFEEILATRSPTYKAVARGELRLIRNSPEEIIEGHREMIARVAGTWVDDAVGEELQSRLRSVFSRYERWHPLNVSSYFLKQHPYLVD